MERLGVYLPVWTLEIYLREISIAVFQTEHIDNPKGYGNGQDPRQFDPRLRGPVDVCT